MSAFMQSTTHIDALLTAGLRLSKCGAVRWHTRKLTDAEKSASFQAGSPWGPGHPEVARKVVRELTRETAGQVGAMLLAQNRYSMDFRYAEEEAEEPYLFNELPGQPDPLIVLKAVAGYEYQACETPDYSETEAHAFCESLRDLAIHALRGYDDAPGWSIDDRNVFCPMKREAKPAAQAVAVESPAEKIDTSLDASIKRIREALKRRSGKAWSVTRGKGTDYCWIKITAPPARLTNDCDGGPCTDPTCRWYMTTEDAAELGQLLGLDKPCHYQGESIAASSEYRHEYIDRAEGRKPSVVGKQYWD